MTLSRSHRLEDRAEIQDIIYRWCSALDRCDWHAIPPLFHAEATDDHVFYSGDIPGLLDWLIPRHANMTQCIHMVGNILIEFAGEDLALVETYLQGSQRHRLPSSGTGSPTEFSTMGFGRYIDRFERRNAEWKILKRTVVVETSIKVELNEEFDSTPARSKARRDGEDVIDMERQELGLAPRRSIPMA